MNCIGKRIIDRFYRTWKKQPFFHNFFSNKPKKLADRKRLNKTLEQSVFLCQILTKKNQKR